MSRDAAGEQLAELEGPDGDAFYGAYLLDWIALCDDLQDSDARGYWVLRALIYDSRGRVNRVRVLSLAELCQLLPGPNGKPSSMSRVRGMLARLSVVGLVSTPEHEPVRTSSRGTALGKALRLKIHDRPYNGYKPRWQNTDEKLDAVRPQATRAARDAAELEASRAAETRAKRAGQNSDPRPLGQNSDPTGRNSDPTGRNSDPDPAAELQDREPYSFPQSSSSLSSATDGPADTRTAAATQAPEERESQQPDDQSQVLAESVVAAYEAALGVRAVNGTRLRLLAEAGQLLTAGYPLPWLRDRAAELPRYGTKLIQHAEESVRRVPLPTQRPEPQQPQAPARPAPTLCAACRDDDGLLYTRDLLTGAERIVGRCSHGAAEAAEAGTGAAR